jgi:threonine aldolase
LVYISNTTEFGTVYTKKELQDLRSVCDRFGLYLYCDGARLGAAMAVSDTDYADYAATCHAFTIGGTKNGALIGEAIVLTNPALQAQFRWHMKQRGAILAKGRLLGIQFLELLKDDLYFELAAHANAMAEKLRRGILELGYEIPIPSTSNLFFPVLPNSVMEKLLENYNFEVDLPVDETHTMIRLVTSWATPETAVDAFLTDLTSCS